MKIPYLAVKQVYDSSPCLWRKKNNTPQMLPGKWSSHSSWVLVSSFKSYWRELLTSLTNTGPLEDSWFCLFLQTWSNTSVHQTKGPTDGFNRLLKVKYLQRLIVWALPFITLLKLIHAPRSSHNLLSWDWERGQDIQTDGCWRKRPCSCSAAWNYREKHGEEIYAAASLCSCWERASWAETDRMWSEPRSRRGQRCRAVCVCVCG